MSSWVFTIKVSDILLHSWSSDTISFTNIFSTKIPWLQPEGISWNILLENLNKSEIFITLIDFFASISTSCDRCGSSFIEQRVLDTISIQAKILDKPLINEDILVIDPKDLTVDIEDFCLDQFFLQQPLKNLCKDCEQISLADEDEKEEVQTPIKRH